MPVSEATREHVIALKSHTTKLNNEIAAQLGIHHSTVTNIWKKWLETGSTKPYQGARMGPPSKLTEKEKRVIVREAKKDPKATSKEIQHASGVIGNKVSTRTIRRVLTRSGLKTYRPIKKPLLTKKHRQMRLKWAREHQNWLLSDWEKVGIKICCFFNFNFIFLNSLYFYCLLKSGISFSGGFQRWNLHLRRRSRLSLCEKITKWENKTESFVSETKISTKADVLGLF